MALNSNKLNSSDHKKEEQIAKGIKHGGMVFAAGVFFIKKGPKLLGKALKIITKI